MPKSNLDWLGIVSIWIGAIIMAIKAADAPLLLGSPTWLASALWGYVPAVLVTIYLVIAVHRLIVRNEKRVQVTAPAEPDAREAIRREMITNGRALVARFNRQTRYEHLMAFLADKPEWHALRAQLDPAVLRNMENGRMIVVTRGNEKDGKVYDLMREIDRLEREWNLI